VSQHDDEPEPDAVTIEFSSESASTLSPSVRLMLNGIDITRSCNSFELTAHVGELTRAEIGLYPKKGFSLKLPASVTLRATVLPGYKLIERFTPDGGKEWEAVPTDEGMA
jgi:hypothetical protein